ncbi:MAG: YqaJ viral recombinase family protein [Acutalibacteraceae bacterium]|nr:YqaJ viral recombinase family protein [Acutalibacteraceae bacterium]
MRTKKELEKIFTSAKVQWEKVGRMYLIDTENMSTEKWETFRAYFCGGSDAGVIVNGLDKYRNTRDIAVSKKTLLGTYTAPENPVYKKEHSTVSLKAGHSLEDMVAKMYAKITGLNVRPLHKMVVREDLPYIAVNFDRIIIDNDGKMRLLEIKTANNQSEYVNWGTSSNPNIPVDYCSQLSTYQMVGEDLFDNRDATIVAFMKDSQIGILAAHCLPLDKEYTDAEIQGLINDGLAESLISRTYKRNKAYEEIIAEDVTLFYKTYVEGNELPVLNGKNSEVDKATLDENTEISNTHTITINNGDVEIACKAILELTEQKKALEKQLDALANQIGNYKNVIIENLNGCENGIAVCSLNNNYFSLSYKGQHRKKTDYKKLELKQPDVYNEFVKEYMTEPSLKVKYVRNRS